MRPHERLIRGNPVATKHELVEMAMLCNKLEYMHEAVHYPVIGLLCFLQGLHKRFMHGTHATHEEIVFILVMFIEGGTMHHRSLADVSHTDRREILLSK